MMVLSFLHKGVAHLTDSEPLKNYIDVRLVDFLPKSNTPGGHSRISNRATPSGNRSNLYTFCASVQVGFATTLFASTYKFETVSVDENRNSTKTTNN